MEQAKSDLLPPGAASASIHVKYEFEGGRHVSEFPAYSVEVLAAPAGEDWQQTVLYFETTFSPLVFQMVGHLRGLLRSAGAACDVVNETHLEL